VVNGAPARLRARRIRVETTTSDSGPLPRSHSPSREVRALRFMVRPQDSDRVAQPCRLFIFFRRDRRIQLGLQLRPVSRAHPTPVPSRYLPRVSAATVVDFFQERLEE